MSNVLVLGFYDRKNMGDDCYRLALPQIFKDCNITFHCSDDINELPIDTDIVIVGGGDVINAYFITKIEQLVRNFIGKVYAFSVGVPYASEGVKYLSIFDHVFVRSTRDFEVVAEEIGQMNVTRIPDASVIMMNSQLSFIDKLRKKKKIGVCLAYPLFCNNEAADELINNIAIALSQFPEYELNLFAFNFSSNPVESDLILNTKIANALAKLHVKSINHTSITNPLDMLKYIEMMEVIVCQRYHSVMFSIIKKCKIVPIYVAQKVDNLLADLNYTDPKYVYKLPKDQRSKPTEIDPQRLADCIRNVIKDNPVVKCPNEVSLLTDAANTIFNKQKPMRMLIKNNVADFDHILFNCKRILSVYLGIRDYETILHKTGPFPIIDNTPLNVSRIISYCITGYIQNPYIWGLAKNIQKEDFNLYTAIQWIWNDMKEQRDIFRREPEHYYPSVSIKRKQLINIDYFFQNDFSSYHRSGWAYAIGGLMNIDAIHLHRNPSQILLDTYVDRSFHWGMDTLLAVGILPYTQPWMGFIHHTFDITHSSYNCVELLKNPVFIESLPQCKGLIVLTKYLAEQLRTALDIVGFTSVPVHVIYHPMEFVSDTFSIDKFINNPNKKVIQIGAWLRKPYSIYELPVSPDYMNPLGLTKAVLRGKDMDIYFKPNDFDTGIKQFLMEDCSSHQVGQGDISRPEGCNSMSRPECYLSRPECYISRNVLSRTNTTNKYCQGLYESISKQDNSVQILEKLSNEKYDELLSENVVFLDMTDCSAVNTVLECLVRNTPLFVNRHPAIEEIFGKEYPGFYTNLVDAMTKMVNIQTITAITDYLSKLDKTKYTLDTFVDAVQSFAMTCKSG